MNKDKKYIAIFTAYTLPHLGGIERYCSNLINQLIINGYTPIIITSNYNNSKDFEIEENIITIRLPIFNTFKNRYPIIKPNKKMKELIKKLDNYPIKRIIVNARFHLTSHVGVMYANKKHIPVYLIEHGSNYVTLHNKFIDFIANRYEDLLTYWLKRRVDGFYGASNACCNWLTNFNIKAKGIWPNAITLSDINIKKRKHESINYLYAGRIIKQKGVYNILTSFNNLSKKHQNINLYIAGDGPELELYKKEFINSRIHFLGKLDYQDLLKYYAICDIFLYPPSWPESLPCSILEAGIMKCAVIATDQGGIKEAITHNKTGLIVSTKQSDLEIAMKKLLLNNNLRNQLSNELYNLIKEKYTWEKTIKKILKDLKLD